MNDWLWSCLQNGFMHHFGTNGDYFDHSAFAVFGKVMPFHFFNTHSVSSKEE